MERTEKFSGIGGALFNFKFIACGIIYIFANLIFIILSAAICVAFAPHKRKLFLSRALRHILAFQTLKLWPRLGMYEIELPPALSEKSGCVYVCNHSSLLDPLFLLSLIPNAGVVIKRKYKNWLAVWVLIKIFDFCVIDSRSPAAAAAAFSSARKILASGRNLIVFPEGKRSKNGRLQDFQGLAFKLAHESNAPVYPCVVFSRYPFLSKGQPWLPQKKGNKFIIDFLPPLESGLSYGKMSDAAYSRISKKLAQLRQSFK